MAVARMLLWIQALWWHFEIRVCINWCIICLQKDDLWHVTKLIEKYKPNELQLSTLQRYIEFRKKLSILMIYSTGYYHE